MTTKGAARKPRAKAEKPGNVICLPEPKHENTSGWTPSRFRVIVRPDEVPSETKGGLMLPPGYVEMERRAGCKGTLIAVAGDAFDMERQTGIPYPKPGDRVLFAKYAGGEFTGDDGTGYRIMNDEDIMSHAVSE